MAKASIARPQYRLSELGMHSYLIPVAGLTIESTWTIGQARLLTAESAKHLVEEGRSSGDLHDELTQPFFAQAASTVVQVTASDGRGAIELAATAVDVLRVYQQSSSRMRTTMFGIPGENRKGSVTYARLGERVGTGTAFMGDHLGFKFPDDQRREFEASVPFQYAASCVGEANPTKAQWSVQSAVKLTSQAILDSRPHMQYLHAVMAAEALLLERAPQPQAYRLARRAAYFTCGIPDEMCGRDRPACVLLKTAPDGKSLRQLKAQRDLGDRDFRERCSEWHHTLDRYDVRSEIVHDGTTSIPVHDASQILFWLTHDLLPAAFTWFATHEVDPIGDLEAEIAALT